VGQRSTSRRCGFVRRVAWAVTAAGFRLVESSLLHELDLASFDDRHEGASPTEQSVLEVIAREPGQLRLTRRRPRLGDIASLDLVVRRLVERGLLYRAGRGAYDFALPLFRGYIRRRAKLTELTRRVRSGAIGVDRAGDVR
jgi:hypothetical protein